MNLSGFSADAKLKIIKEIKTFMNVGLKEAKEMVEKGPFIIKEDISKDEAEEIKKKFEGLGGQIEIK